MSKITVILVFSANMPLQISSHALYLYGTVLCVSVMYIYYASTENEFLPKLLEDPLASIPTFMLP